MKLLKFKLCSVLFSGNICRVSGASCKSATLMSKWNFPSLSFIGLRFLNFSLFCPQVHHQSGFSGYWKCVKRETLKGAKEALGDTGSPFWATGMTIYHRSLANNCLQILITILMFTVLEVFFCRPFHVWVAESLSPFRLAHFITRAVWLQN